MNKYWLLAIILGAITATITFLLGVQMRLVIFSLGGFLVYLAYGIVVGCLAAGITLAIWRERDKVGSFGGVGFWGLALVCSGTFVGILEITLFKALDYSFPDRAVLLVWPAVFARMVLVGFFSWIYLTVDGDPQDTGKPAFRTRR